MYIRRASSPSTVLWAFHTIQPSSSLCCYTTPSSGDVERLLVQKVNGKLTRVSTLSRTANHVLPWHAPLVKW